MREADVLLCASMVEPPCRIDKADEVERSYPGQARTPFNVTGHPALAMSPKDVDPGVKIRFQEGCQFGR